MVVGNLYVLRFLYLALLMAMAAATQFRVGGLKGWTVPTDDPGFYSKWAEGNRFQTGDSLLFVYPQGQDSVLHVSQEGYNTCNTAAPIDAFQDGNTVFALNSSGPFYFISGNQENCIKNESLVVVVLAERNNNASAPSLPPSPSVVSPPPPPSLASPPPMASLAPPPPSQESSVTPTTSPPAGASISPSPNRASPLMAMSFRAPLGALLGLILYIL
ncbi:Cupredoxins domain-containing protein [Dioscorea alata]|uniref:Cupredoxins domain-containing protein n=1 Tax=Dioscorea alata TaxID=55571 RepID=A0ACB7VN82_DIOAL|nr:Cupredoxins domain-containing protein [Dioscorea alata]